MEVGQAASKEAAAGVCAGGRAGPELPLLSLGPAPTPARRRRPRLSCSGGFRSAGALPAKFAACDFDGLPSRLFAGVCTPSPSPLCSCRCLRALLAAIGCASALREGVNSILLFLRLRRVFLNFDPRKLFYKIYRKTIVVYLIIFTVMQLEYRKYSFFDVEDVFSLNSIVCISQ